MEDPGMNNTSIESDFRFEDSQDRTNSSGTTTSTPSSCSDYVTGDADDSSESNLVVPFSLKSVEALLAISKTTTQLDLLEMIENCKRMVLDSKECSEERKWLVRRLIELRLRAHELRETSGENVMETKVVLGHHLVPQKYYIATTSPTYCDPCSRAIWTILQSWYMCRDCSFCCHWKCINNIRRVCAHVVACETGGYTYTMKICPEKGLSAQAYRCAECQTRITFALSKGLSLSCFGSPFRQSESAWIEPRLCDYTGLFYCQRCHWNSTAVIPARVIRNWDMEPRKVCRSSAQILAILEDRPVLQLEELNTKLFGLIPDLTLIKHLREELQMMKSYLVFCPEADIEGLPWRVGLRTHFIENSGNYSIRDLIDLQNGILMDEIRSAYDTMQYHIAESCELCKARGHLCEICGNDEVIYPWEASAVSCRECRAVHHRACWSKRNNCCPKCARIEQRMALKSKGDPRDLEDENSTSDPHSSPILRLVATEQATMRNEHEKRKTAKLENWTEEA
ncbi:differentially expressed in FDCP 8 homolog isoform X2 [Venturia canescens]|uniref:differentially expressed in FDCP 8 homolog isoform X2 n=1 Tax=Venturia canescens TaxID=32260 RepID=UPI001C9CA9B9|nr:differentially expressed in FDCP 8 homolog isoform X2 [Venturia canescens]XP_043287640.1 differentially expressed in FDCP 8 homolog isoform X2 [Venturia canescens]